jgi:Helix-turn-helix domain
MPPHMTPSLEQLAEACGCWKSTVVAALDHLEDHGWLTRTRTTKRDAKGPGRGHKTAYQLLSGCECPPSCDRYRDRRPAPGDGGRQSPTSPKGSDSRTLSERKGSDSGLRKGPIRTRKPAGQPVSDEGIREGEDRQGSSFTEQRVCDVTADKAVDVTHSLRSCSVCQLPMDPVLPAAGFTTHPCCDPDEVSPLRPQPVKISRG